MLELRTLGALDVRTADGRVLETVLAQPRRLALLVYLAAATPRKLHRRDALLALFWPEADEPRARNALNQALHFLRRSLGEGVIVSRGEEIGLDLAQLWCDAVAFERALEARDLVGALELYRGEFLPGFFISEAPEFERWLERERARLRERAMQAMRTLAGEREAAGDPAGAAAWWRRLAAEDPLDSRTALRLMQALAASGDRAGALQHARVHTALLREELEAEPDPEVAALAEELRQTSALSPAPPPAPEPRPEPEPQTNLPSPPAPLIGRERELGAIRERLLADEVRLLTLTGTGGIGKTRLALQAAAELRPAFEGVYFVDLAPVTGPELVIPTVAQALGLRDAGERPVLATLKEYLRERRTLLLLDNFEHLLEAAPLVAELLAAAPGLRVLATSRAALRLRMEHEQPVPPLAVPDPGERAADELSRYAAVELFLLRARAVRPDLELDAADLAAVAGICARLDGLPLAIELAAARMKVLSPQTILARLGSRLQLLTSGPRDLPARQQTLRNTLEWSYGLLTPGEQTLLRRLAVFAGGCSLEAAEAVCSGDGDPGVDVGQAAGIAVLEGIASLVDRSMLIRRQDTAGEPRYAMLETIQEYAQERLEESGEAEEVRSRHAVYFLRLAERAEPHLRGPEQVLWLRALQTEHDNLRAALQWALLPPREGEAMEDVGWRTEVALRFGGALWRFWWVQGHLSEGRRWLGSILSRAGAAEGAPAERAPSPSHYLRAEVLRGAGILAWNQGDAAAARSHLEESLALERELDNPPGLARSLNMLALVAKREEDYAGARLLLEESLALMRELGDQLGIETALNNLGVAAFEQGDYAAARVHHQESLDIARRIGNQRGVVTSLLNLGLLAIAEGELPTAYSLLRESLQQYQVLGDLRGTIECLEGLAGVAAGRGEARRAGRLLAAAEALRASIGALPAAADRARIEQYTAAARARLGAAAWEAGWGEGSAMTVEQAVACALEG